ncbi:hypothetical protein BC832DRAFT_539819 [Gaertneriomyces semiglobifer]|nr:hypothetical protein BC832DRAFT_539819 [Gaertneriomyces semiglobifer]
MSSVPDRGDIEGSEPSVSAFISSVIFNSAVAVALYTGFLVLRRRFPLVYAPRTFLVPEGKRAPPLQGTWSWFTLFRRINEPAIIAHAGADQYAAIYYMRMLFRFFLGATILAIIILFPTYATGTARTSGLSKLTIANVADDQSSRLWAALVVSYIFIAFALYTIRELLMKSAWLRHTFLMGDEQRGRLSGYVLVVRDIPEKLRNKKDLLDLFNRVQPNTVVDVVLTRDDHDVSSEYKKYVKNRDGLEKAASKYLSTVASRYGKTLRQKGSTNYVDPEVGNAVPSEILQNRPTRKTPMIIGAKVDSISDYITHMRDLQQEMEQKRTQLYTSNGDAESAAFIIFKDLFAPHAAATANIHGTPGVMDDKQAVVEPEDIIWDNLSMKFFQRQIRTLIALVALIALVLFWAVITAFVAGIASLDHLAKTFTFLEPFQELPASIQGIIQGVLPTIAIAVLYALLPVILRFFTSFSGAMTHTAIEKRLIGQYYFFLVFNILFIVTISGSIFNTAKLIADNPGSVFEILGTSIPKVSTFFVNYVMLLALGGPAKELLQLGNVIAKPLVLRFLSNTPRVVWRQSQPKPFKSGAPLARHTFIATVGITYLSIAPLVSLMCAIYFGFWYVAYTYQMQYVYHSHIQSGGYYLYSSAKQLFVALYIHEVVLTALFFIKTAWVPGGFMVFAILVTIMFHRYTNAYDSLMEAVPAKAALDEAKRRHLTMDTDIQKQLVQNETWRDEMDPTGRSSELSPGEKGDRRESRVTLGSTSDDPNAAGTEVQDTPSRYEGPDDYEKQFMAPALRSDALVVWLPQDQLGVSEIVKEEVESGCQSKVCYEGAKMNEKGQVSVATATLAKDHEP